MRVELQTYDINSLVNKAWDKSFARTMKNKVVNSDRVWNHLNCNILTFPEIRATTTTQKIEEENILTNVTLPFKAKTILTITSPSFETKYLIPTPTSPNLTLILTLAKDSYALPV